MKRKNELTYEYQKTADLIPYARNARIHDEQQVKELAASIKEFGFINPIIIDKDNGIIAGHGRIMAAEKLKLEKVPCLRVEHLTKAQKKAYILIDNRSAEKAKWDKDLLQIELDELGEMGFGMDDFGFADFDFDSIDGDDRQKEEYQGNTDEDEVPEVAETEPKTKLGDIYIFDPYWECDKCGKRFDYDEGVGKSCCN